MKILSVNARMGRFEVLNPECRAMKCVNNDCFSKAMAINRFRWKVRNLIQVFNSLMIQ